MKHFYLPFLLVFLLFSCSETEPISGNPDPDGEDPDPDTTLEACFSLSAESLTIGESLEISNCSEGATSYLYDFGNGEESTAQNPTVVFNESGEYTITLSVSNSDQDSDSMSLTVTVTAEESTFLYPNIPAGYSYLPLEVGIHPISSALYILELREDLIGPGGAKFYYRELDGSFSSTSYYIADKPFESNGAFLNVFASGNMNFHFSRTLVSLYGSQELTYNSAWGFISNINPANKLSYGYLPDASNYFYFGTAEDSGVYKAAVEHRNSVGDTYQIDLFGLGSASSMIGDMIKVSGGYVAFGGVFTKNTFDPHIQGYKPVLAFFDNSMLLASEVVLNESALDGMISSPNDLNGKYHLGQLGNGNLVVYGNGELMVTGSNGNFIKKLFFENTKPIQALVVNGDSFIISTNEYLRKFDSAGNQLKEFKYNGNYCPQLLEKDGKLFFVAGYDTEDGIKTFYGAVDTNLNIVPFVM